MATQLDLSDVNVFAVAAAEGTITGAARHLSVPTSTVSRSLTRLEKHIGVLLVRRGVRC